jgi:hypothetical protein
VGKGVWWWSGFQINSACSKYMFYFYKFDFESWLLLKIFIVKGTLIVDGYLHGARVDDIELHLAGAAIISVSHAIEQTFFHFCNVYLLPYPDYT